MPHPDPSPLLKLRGICKGFPGVQALSDVDIHVDRGEVLAIIGENGAGKSTLIKTIGGAIRHDRGTIEIDGEVVELDSPHRAQQEGIAVIYQEFNLVPYLSVHENIFLGHAKQRFGVIDKQAERREARAILKRLGMPLDADSLVSTLSIAQQQFVEIAKGLISNLRILILDEPTATLTPREVAKLFETIVELKSRGIAIVYISHRLNEILDVADRVVVLRDGSLVGQRQVDMTNRREMIEMMVGRNIETEFPKKSCQPGKVRLEVQGLGWTGRVSDVSFQVRAGEVLGITGLVGAGRTEVAQLLSGARRPDTGEIRIDGAPVEFASPRVAIASGICLLSEDRKNHGLVLKHSVQENFGLPNLDQFSRHGFISGSAESKSLSRFVASLKISLASPRQPANQLSGGNQQKLVLAKWLQRNCEIIIIDEPTRGIDVGAKYEIYLLINELAAQGKAVIMISSELPEVLGMSDRILVMRQGRIVGEIDDLRTASQEQLMELAAH